MSPGWFCKLPVCLLISHNIKYSSVCKVASISIYSSPDVRNAFLHYFTIIQTQIKVTKERKKERMKPDCPF